MRAILATLEAPLRSWGGASLGDDRGSLHHPTASGMLGFLGACAGIDRHDAALSERWYAAWDVITISERSPSMMVDYQSIHRSRMSDGTVNANAVISSRTYLLSSVECVAFIEQKEGEFYDAALAALSAPAYTPFVGRKSNPLMAPPDAEAVNCTSAADIAEKLRERWNRATANSPFLMIAPMGILERPVGGCIRMVRSISDQRNGATGAHSAAMREFLASTQAPDEPDPNGAEVHA